MNIRTLITRCAHVAARIDTAKAQPRLRVRSIARRPGGSRLAVAGGEVGAGNLPDGRREEPVLSTAGARVSRTHRSRVAADRPDEGPDRLPDPEGHRRRTA